MRAFFLLFFLPLLLLSDKIPNVAITSESDIAFVQKIGEHTPLFIQSYNTSLNNILALKAKKVDFVIINSDSAYHLQGLMPNLRSVVALYPKMLTFITKKESNITAFKEIKSKNLKIAFTGRDAQVYKQVLEAYEIKYTGPSMTFKTAKTALNEDKIDGFFSLVGHPSRQIERLHREQDITIIPLYGKKFDQLKNDHTYIMKGGIPKEMYNEQEDIKSIGVKALLVTREDMNETVIENITKTILENIPDIKKSDYIYRGISKKSLLEGHSIQQHKASIKAFNAF